VPGFPRCGQNYISSGAKSENASEPPTRCGASWTTERGDWPAPDEERIEGKASVVAFWRGWFARNPDAQFEAEEIIVSGDRAVVRRVYHKLRNGQPCHLRGVDIFTVREGKSQRSWRM
jgi:ketosteroid isomerase-like protein